jgi:hypothetical protein
MTCMTLHLGQEKSTIRNESSGLLLIAGTFDQQKRVSPTTEVYPAIQKIEAIVQSLNLNLLTTANFLLGTLSMRLSIWTAITELLRESTGPASAT